MSQEKVKIRLIRKDGVIQAYLVNKDHAEKPETRARVAPTKAQQGGPVPRRRGARYSTWFRAVGTMGRDLAKMRGGPSPTLLEEDFTDDEITWPGAFYSSESGLLGRVKWEGVMPLEAIIDELNMRLQVFGAFDPNFDFRLVYSQWEYKYEIFAHIGVFTESVFIEFDSKPKRRGRAR